MNWKDEWKKLAMLTVAFLACFYLPVEYIHGWARLRNAVWESLYLVRWYAQEHVLLCLVPAFFIAGAIAVFVSQASVMKYLGPKAKKVLAYGVASVSGTILSLALPSDSEERGSEGCLPLGGLCVPKALSLSRGILGMRHKGSLRENSPGPEGAPSPERSLRRGVDSSLVGYSQFATIFARSILDFRLQIVDWRWLRRYFHKS